MTHRLMAHQVEGVDFLRRSGGGLLAFEQGLGKTLVAIEAFRQTRATGDTRRLLVICPNSLKRNWQSELAANAPDLDVTIVEGPRPVRRQLFATAPSAVLITSYETARNEVTAILALLKRDPTALVLDESHATKNRRSLTSTAARHFAPAASHRWLLSGTPVTNSPADLYTQIGILSPTVNPLGPFDSYLATVESRQANDAISARLAPYLMRRTKEQCLDLPDKTFVDIRVELPAWQRALYEQMQNDMVCAIEGMSNDEYRVFASTALVQLMRLAQIATNPSLVLPSSETPGKFEEIDQLLEEILSNPSHKAIVWSSYVKTIEQLTSRYVAYGACSLYGGTPVDTRQDIAAQFQSNPNVRVLVGNPAAAGTGFTLTAATYSIYESLSWRYDYYAQSQDRNHRIGQSKPVTYLRMIAADTIEEAIIAALERKSEIAKYLLGDDKREPAIRELTREQMCSLILRNRLPDA